MTTLDAYLDHKRQALAGLREKLKAPEAGPKQISATAHAEGRSGVRRIRIRDFQVLSDSPPDFAGYNLGPSSPELQLGVLASCLTHSFLIQAADLQIPLDDLEVEVTADIDSRGSLLARADIPVFPHNIRYRVRVSTPAGPEAAASLEKAVDRACPILNLLRNPQTISGEVEYRPAVRHAAE